MSGEVGDARKRLAEAVRVSPGGPTRGPNAVAPARVDATEVEALALDLAATVFGWQHLARYSGQTREWLDATLLAIVRSTLNAADMTLRCEASDPKRYCAVSCARRRAGADECAPRPEHWANQPGALPPSDGLAERRVRDEWADYFENWLGAVGPQPPTVEGVIRLLRAQGKPFGLVAAPGAEGDAS